MKKFAVLLAIGVALRFIVAGVGFTYDLQSYEIVAKIVNAGGSVYSETSRYNYGPVWFLFLGLVYKIASLFPDIFLAFRFLIVMALTGVDLVIWYLLTKYFSVKAGLLFFLNPISIILTGYYSQFDNLAVMLGLIAVLLFNQKRMLALSILGLSLMTKHIFFAFPFWLAISEKGFQRKVFVLFVPLLFFVLGFLPFVFNSFDGIKQNVLFYSSFNNAPFWQFLIPDYLKRIIRKELLFFGMLLIGAFIFRNKKPQEKLLFYSITLVTFSYAIADQYLAIVLPFISIFPNAFFLAFTIVQTVFFGMIMNGGEMIVEPIGIFFDRSSFGFTLQILLLFLGLLFLLYRIYCKRSNVRHVIVVLLFLNSIFFVGIALPSYLENQRMKPILHAMEQGDYELANDLYHQIEINPPFAGSRFYEKLRQIRYNVEYYRNYRHILDIYHDETVEKDWKDIKKKLIIVPSGFPDQAQIKEILSTAEEKL